MKKLILIIYSLVFLLSCPPLFAQQPTLSKYIVVDQFGYLPESRKIAVIRDPQVGFDAAESFTPGNSYSLVSTTGDLPVLTAAPVSWKSGSTDNSSGDKAWWFDFSSVTTPGKYYVLDVQKQVRSFEFEISDVVYNPVLRHAVRTFFYQRAGHAKAAQYAGAAWQDGASHIGPLQDKNARPYNEPNNSAKEIDVSGGWYDAGDYNKYTNWTANYVVDFMRAYIEDPGVWTDDYNIPESGNGVPDLLDEAKWGIDHLLRMQQSDGSVLSIVGLSHASPPSAATGRSLYGTASTSAALNTAGAFAIASGVYASIGQHEYADLLKENAIKAWDWAEANPNVIFKNNDSASGTSGLGAGQQETDNYGRLTAKIEAAVFLFEITGDTKYKTFIDNNYASVNMMEWNFAFPFQTTNQEMLLHYASLPSATTVVANQIKNVYKNAMLTGSENFPAYYAHTDPYLAHLKDYTWGSNSIRSSQGLMYMDIVRYGIDASKNEDAKNAAEQYIHYLHGVNPLNMVYLSNMYAYGGDNCVNEFYHTWFAHGSPKWDRVGVSTYGPPPGFLSGGPNPSYNWDGCCPSSCGSSGNNAVCTSESITPPKGQPNQKSYKDFNTSWPLNSWEVTENSDGYQINYIRLLSKFIQAGLDCNGTPGGTASFDACHRCAGGTTGITPATDNSECADLVTVLPREELNVFQVYPNPTTGIIQVSGKNEIPYHVTVTTVLGQRIFYSESNTGTVSIDLGGYPKGIFIVTVDQGNTGMSKKVVKY